MADLVTELINSNIFKHVAVAILTAVALAVPKLWVDIIMIKRDHANNQLKFKKIFDKVDAMSNDVSFIRGKLDDSNGEKGEGKRWIF